MIVLVAERPDGGRSGFQPTGSNRRVRVPGSLSLRRGRANEAETWIVDGAVTATSTAIPQTV